jgi:hypothetical protein
MPRLWWRVRNKHRSHEECGRNWWRRCIVYMVNVQCVKSSSSSTGQGCGRERYARSASRTRLIAPPVLFLVGVWIVYLLIFVLLVNFEPALRRFPRPPRPSSQTQIQAQSISLSPKGSSRDRPFDRVQSSYPCLCVMRRRSRYGMVVPDSTCRRLRSMAGGGRVERCGCVTSPVLSVGDNEFEAGSASPQARH